jgi:5-methylcytosine-specific restriction endonuclease McrA
MGIAKRYHRHSAVVIARKQWKAVRHLALKRDGFKCVQCGARGRLEVDHILPVRTHPLLAYELSNTQTLCVACHSRKTAVEVGLTPLDPARVAWRELVKSPLSKESVNA